MVQMLTDYLLATYDSNGTTISSFTISSINNTVTQSGASTGIGNRNQPGGKQSKW